MKNESYSLNSDWHKIQKINMQTGRDRYTCMWSDFYNLSKNQIFEESIVYQGKTEGYRD